VDSWVSACDELKIEITAKEAQPALQAYRDEPQKTSLEDSRPEFSHDTFVDALVEFVVADDQVNIRFTFMVSKLTSLLVT
jgi:hypothetical protein